MARDDAKYYRKEWMSGAQWECAVFLADLFHGFHHLSGSIKAATECGVECNVSNSRLATFDYDELTRAVFMAHDRCIRFEVAPSGPGRLRLYVHKRNARTGSMYERHPTLEAAVTDWRSQNPAPDLDVREKREQARAG